MNPDSKFIDDNRQSHSENSIVDVLNNIIPDAPTMKELEAGNIEGARKALEEIIPQERIEAFKETLKATPDELVGSELDNLVRNIVSFIEKNPSEYVLIKLLWIITSLAEPKSLFAFSRALATIGALKGIMESED